MKSTPKHWIWGDGGGQIGISHRSNGELADEACLVYVPPEKPKKQVSRDTNKGRAANGS